jgi:hypothetical protein
MSSLRGKPAAAVALALTSLVTGCSLALDFSDPPVPPDAVPVDALPMAACDFGEPNESRAMAFALTPGAGTAAGICEEGDRDVYAITVADGQALDFAIRFAQPGASGDLEMFLIDEAGTTLARSLSPDADERIVCPSDGAGPPCTQLAAGNYFVEVFGFSDTAINTYTIEFALTGP